MELRLDLQTHTRYSESCGWMSPEQLVNVAKKSLDGIAVTDHNTMAAVEEAVTAAPEDLLVIPGEEIDTQTGQIIGLFLKAEISPGQAAGTVIEQIHDQGGIAFTPHPFDAMRDGLADISAHTETLDAIEVMNSRCIRSSYNEQAASFAREHDLMRLGGSDAHFPNEVGNAYTIVDVDEETIASGSINPAAVATAIRTGNTRPMGHRGRLLNHVGTKIVKLYRKAR